MFAEKIRQLREHKHLLQRQVSAALDMDNALYCKIERGARVAKREHVIKLAELLQIDKDELLKLWLADKVYGVVKNEEKAKDALSEVKKILDIRKKK